MVAIDYTITVGNICEILSMVIGGVYAVASIRRNVGLLKSEVGAMQAEIKKIAELMKAVAVQDIKIDNISERLNLLDKRYDELRHGVGEWRPNDAHPVR